MAQNDSNIYYNGNANNPTFYTLGTNGQYQQIADPSNTPLGNLSAMGSSVIASGAVPQVPQGGVTIPTGAQVSDTTGGTPGNTNSTGVSSTLGSNLPQVPTPPAPTDVSSQYASSEAGLTSANAGVVQALQEQENAAVAQTQQAQAGETAGYAQTAATLQGIGGISTLWTNFFSNLNENHQTTLNALKAQYDSAIGSANMSLASQIATMQQNAIAANQQQQQQFFENSMSVYNAQVGLVNQQVTQSQSQQQINLQQQNQTFQQQQASLTNFQNEFNAVIPSLEGQGWNTLSPQQQSQITTMAQNAGIQPQVVQSLINTKQVAGTATATDLFGNSTVMMYDKNGNVLRTINMGGGVDPNSAAGQSILQGFTTTDSASGFQYVNKGNLPTGQEQGAVLNWAASNSIPILSATQATAAQQLGASLGQVQDVQNKVENDLSQLAISSPDLITGYAGRTLDQLLQITGNSSDPNAKQAAQDLNTLSSLNTQLIGPLRSAAGMTGAGGIGLSAILNQDQGDFISPNQTMQTILGNLGNLTDSINTSLESLGWKGPSTSTTGSGGSGTSDVGSFITNLLGTNNNTQSTPSF